MITDSNYCYRTNIDMSQAFKLGYQLPNVGMYKEIWNIKPPDMFNQTWLDNMIRYGIPVEWVLLFYRPAHIQTDSAHIDSYGTNGEIPVSALNWIIGGRGSEMRWYNNPTTPLHINYTKRGMPYIQFPIDSLEEAYRTNIGNGLSLVRVDIPHAVFIGDEPRWCISLRNNLQLDSWYATVERLRNLGLLVD